MDESLELEIREHLQRYLDGTNSLQEFEQWFVTRTWNVEQLNLPGSARLTHEINLRLAEYTIGHRSLDDLNDLLRSMLASAAPTRAAASGPE